MTKRAIRWCASVMAAVIGLAGASRALAEVPARLSDMQMARPVEAITHVIIISVDGLRPDLLIRGNVPNLRRMCEEGTFTFWAHTTDVAVTLPSHTSMLTGVVPERHGISWNSSKDEPPADQMATYPRVPTLFDIAHAAGRSTALVAGKDKFRALLRGGAVDHSWITDLSVTTNSEVIDQAERIVREKRPQVMFIHLPETDTAGHAHGWGSAEQMAALANADACIGRLRKTLQDAGLSDSTAIIISSDHGGAGRTHGGTDPRSRFIPWIIVGPGLAAGRDLTFDPKVIVRTEDTFATACYLLGLALPPDLDGQVVRRVVPGSELLEPTAGVSVPPASQPVRGEAKQRDPAGQAASR